MTRFAIDAPTLLHVVESGLSLADEHQLVAPRSIRTDALQLLLDDVRASRRTEREARALHDPVTELRVRALGDRVTRGVGWRIALDHDGLGVAAAEYVAVARQQADVLVTTDPALVAAAEGVVPVVGPQALDAAS
jgi:predicted nucleic acid-binding protein